MIDKQSFLEEVERTAAVVRRSLSRALRPYGVALSEARALITLSRLAQKTPASAERFVPLSDVADGLITEGPVSRLFNELLRKNLIEKRISPTDQRAKDIRLTKEGTKLIPSLKKALTPKSKEWKAQNLKAAAIARATKTLIELQETYQ